MKQPLVAVAILYGAGVVLGYFIEAPLWPVLLAAFAMALIALCANQLRAWLLPAVLLLFGWANMTTRTALISPNDLRSILRDRASIVSVRGRIDEAPSQRVILRNGVEKSHTLAVIEVNAIQLKDGSWQPAFGQVMSRTTGTLPAPFVEGQDVEIAGIALQPAPPVAEGLFNYAHYLKLRGIHYELKVESPEGWKPVGSFIPAPISDRFRTWAQRTLARGLPGPDESLRLQWAMLLGWQTALTAEVSEPFMRSGTMHIFAISGLHIALIAGIFLALLRALTVPRFFCGATVIGIIWFYTAATGWQASAIRSTVMMTVILTGWMLKRPVNLLNSLAAAACIILVWQPEQLFQASFQLSFFVVLSLALLSPPIEKLKQHVFKLDPLLPWELRPWWKRFSIKMGQKVWTGLATSVAAFIGSAPLIAYYFHLFTPGSVLANLVVVPVSTCALMSGLGALVTGDALPFLTEWFNNSGWVFMRSMIWLSEQAADTPAAWWHVRAPGPVLFFFYYGLLLTICAGWLGRKLLRWAVVSYALALAALWTIQWQRGRAWHQLTVLPLHAAHSVYVQPSHDGKEWLINSGDRSAVGSVLKPFLQADGADWIENLMLTHGDTRYVGGAMSLHEIFPIRATLVSPVASRSPRYRELLAELEKKTRLNRSATNGFSVKPWRILHPGSSGRFPNAADNSIVALGKFDDVTVLLVANPGRAGQNAVFARHPDLRADIVVTGLPENQEQLAVEWMEVIRPKLLIVADSEPPSHRATSELLRRLRRTGAEVIDTRSAGAVTVSIRESIWRIKTARGLRGSDSESNEENE